MNALVRRTPLKRKSWLTPTVPLIRLARSKPAKWKATTAVERRHLDRVAAMPCLVCGRDSTVHHVTSDGHQRLTRTHERVEALGHAGFTATYGIDLLTVAKRLWAESQLIEKGHRV